MITATVENSTATPEPPAVGVPPQASGSPVRYTKRIHMCQSVRGPLMNWTKRQWKDATEWITPKDGGQCTGDELKAHFLKLLTDGNEVIPIGECDNFDPKTGCRGHDIVENVVMSQPPETLRIP